MQSIKRFLLLFFVVCILIVLPLSAAGDAESTADSPVTPEEIQILSHRVHQSITTAGAGSDIISECFQETTTVSSVIWNTQKK
jgi:hypothetical protein